jgi:hypothetical protein
MAATDYAVSGGKSFSDNTVPQYVGLQGRLVTISHRDRVAQEMSRSGTAVNLRVRLVGISSASGTVTITLMDGGTATDLAVSIPANSLAAIFQDTTHSVSFSEGAALSWRIQLPTTSGTWDTTFIQWIACEIG